MQHVPCFRLMCSISISEALTLGTLGLSQAMATTAQSHQQQPPPQPQQAPGVGAGESIPIAASKNTDPRMPMTWNEVVPSLHGVPIELEVMLNEPQEPMDPLYTQQNAHLFICYDFKYGRCTKGTACPLRHSKCK